MDLLKSKGMDRLNKRVWINFKTSLTSTLYFFQLFPKQYDSLFDYLHKNCPYHKKCSATWCEDENVTNSKPRNPKMHSYESNETTRGGEK